MDIIESSSNNVFHKVSRISDSDTSIKLSREDLLSHGCRNCVWKFHGMCPHGLSGDDFLDAGICNEFTEFLYSLVGTGDSKNVLWENYNLYVLRLQSLEDYRNYVKLQDDIKRLESEGVNPVQLDDLESKKNALKMWWYKLNDSVIRGLGRVVDREKRAVSESKPKLSVQQLNILIDDSSERLLRYEKENKGAN